MAGEQMLQAKVAVVGHVEWVDFAVVPRLPHPGEILHVHEFWAEAAGGGAVAVVQMAKLTGGALFFTALADDELGAPHGGAARRPGRDSACGGAAGHPAPRLHVPDRRRGAHDHDPRRPARRRTATTGSRGRCSTAIDGVYFTGGDAGGAAGGAAGARRRRHAARRRARCARPGSRSTCSCTPATTPARSSTRPSWTRRRGRSSRRSARRAVAGRGRRAAGRGRRSRCRGRCVDEYGAGDSFAAGLTTGLAAGLPIAGRRRARRALRRGEHDRPRPVRGPARPALGRRSARPASAALRRSPARRAARRRGRRAAAPPRPRPSARGGREHDVVARGDGHRDARRLPPVDPGPDRQHDAVLRRRLVRAGRHDEPGLADPVGLELLDHHAVEEGPQLLAHGAEDNGGVLRDP